MTREDLAAWVGNWAELGSQKHAELMATLQARCTGDLVAAIKSLEAAQTKSAQSSDKLAWRVFWLNIVVAMATVVGAIIAYLTYLQLP